MTASRIVRGTKARILLYICAVLIITGIIACYNNTLSQLENAKKSNEICHQQEENLSTQLQVISEYKQRLEKSLKTEKAEHQQGKTELENKLNEERTKNEKASNEANLRFNSLQQHFNMLQTQYEDLQNKLKELEDELNELKSTKESLKSKYLILQSKNEQLHEENQNFQVQVQQHIKNNGDDQSTINHLTKENHQLQSELNEMKSKCPVFESIQAPHLPLVESSSTFVNVSKQTTFNNSKIKRENNEQSVQRQGPSNFIKIPSSSTTRSSLKVSQGDFNEVRPLLVPTMTPKGPKLGVLAAPLLPKKVPDGVVPVPERQDQKKTENEKNELPDETVNNRYQNKINEISLYKEEKKGDEPDKENVGHEVFDQHNMYDNFGLGEVIDPKKNAVKQSLNNQHIDQLDAGSKVDEVEDNQQIEENEPEDDDPDYADHLGRIKEPAVRN